MRSRRLVKACLLGTTIVVVGCGGSRSKGPATTGSTDSRTSTTATAPLSALRSFGRGALLVPADLPGWSSTPPETEAKEPALEKEVARCIGVPVSVIEDKPAEVHSRQFKHGTTEASDDVTVSTSVGEARTVFAAWGRPASAGCLAKGIGTALRNHLASQSTDVGALAFERPRVQSLALGSLPASFRGYRFEFSVRAGTDTLRLYFDAVLLRSGRTNATVTFGDQGEPVDTATEKRLVSLVAGRLARLQAN